MFDDVLARIQVKVRAFEYVMTLHADEEMHEDRLRISDIEHTIHAGQIVERQRDRRTREWKYLIAGPTADDIRVVVVAKISPTGMVVIVTVYVA